MNRFRNPIMRRQYDAAVKAYQIRHRDLFLPSGERRGLRPLTLGSSFATYFWHGFDNVRPESWSNDRGARQMIAYAFYRAGRDCALQEAKP